jgi:putative tryptophan/tyrosine transport system substrate-binding protein
MIRRREFIAGLGGAAALPLAARAQPASVPLIGYLNGATPALYRDRVGWFLEGLGQVGFVDGQNVAIEYRWANGQYEKLPALAADLVRRQVGVIAATGGIPEVSAAKTATSRIPIVFQSGADPVAAGLVASLARPGGNVTGVTQMAGELLPKELQLLREMVPAATTVAFLVNPTNPGYPGAEVVARQAQTVARPFGLQVLVLEARVERDISNAFEEMAQRRAGLLMIGADLFFGGQRERLAALALGHHLPAVFPFRDFVVAGGLMSYGGSLAEVWRLVGVYTGRILKGERPEDLPVQQGTKFELVIILKTAKALGLTIPPNLLAIADEVIE